MKPSFTTGSGNVFIDLGFEPAEAEVLLMRSDLMADISKYISTHRLSQLEAARRLGVTQSRVSDLVRGKFDKFSLDMLLTMEGRLGRAHILKRAPGKRVRTVAA